MTFIQKYKVLTTIDEFNSNNLCFDKPKDEEVGGNKHIKGKRIKIGILKDGKVAELIIPTEKLYAYKGVLPTKPFGKEDSDEIIGYNIPIALYSRDDVNGRDKRFVEIFREIIDKTKDHVVSVKKTIGQPHLVKELLYKWDNILYEKKDESGEPVNDFGPTLYAKLMYSKERNQIATKLVDIKGRHLELNDVLNKPCGIITCVKFESIYINSNGCSLQVKLTEAILDIKESENTQNLLLQSFLNQNDDEVAEDTVLENNETNVFEESGVLNTNTEQEEHCNGGDSDIVLSDNPSSADEMVNVEEVAPKKRAVKRIVKK